MVEIDASVLMTLATAVNIPTWSLIIWILKIQRTSCERLSRMEGENSIAHKKKK